MAQAQPIVVQGGAYLGAYFHTLGAETFLRVVQGNVTLEIPEDAVRLVDVRRIPIGDRRVQDATIRLQKGAKATLRFSFRDKPMPLNAQDLVVSVSLDAGTAVVRAQDTRRARVIHGALRARLDSESWSGGPQSALTYRSSLWPTGMHESISQVCLLPEGLYLRGPLPMARGDSSTVNPADVWLSPLGGRNDYTLRLRQSHAFVDARGEVKVEDRVAAPDPRGADDQMWRSMREFANADVRAIGFRWRVADVTVGDLEGSERLATFATECVNALAPGRIRLVARPAHGDGIVYAWSRLDDVTKEQDYRLKPRHLALYAEPPPVSVDVGTSRVETARYAPAAMAVALQHAQGRWGLQALALCSRKTELWNADEETADIALRWRGHGDSPRLTVAANRLAPVSWGEGDTVDDARPVPRAIWLALANGWMQLRAVLTRPQVRPVSLTSGALKGDLDLLDFIGIDAETAQRDPEEGSISEFRATAHGGSLVAFRWTAGRGASLSLIDAVLRLRLRECVYVPDRGVDGQAVGTRAESPPMYFDAATGDALRAARPIDLLVQIVDQAVARRLASVTLLSAGALQQTSSETPELTVSVASGAITIALPAQLVRAIWQPARNLDLIRVLPFPSAADSSLTLDSSRSLIAFQATGGADPGADPVTLRATRTGLPIWTSPDEGVAWKYVKSGPPYLMASLPGLEWDPSHGVWRYRHGLPSLDEALVQRATDALEDDNAERGREDDGIPLEMTSVNESVAFALRDSATGDVSTEAVGWLPGRSTPISVSGGASYLRFRAPPEGPKLEIHFLDADAVPGERSVVLDANSAAGLGDVLGAHRAYWQAGADGPSKDSTRLWLTSPESASKGFPIVNDGHPLIGAESSGPVRYGVMDSRATVRWSRVTESEDVMISAQQGGIELLGQIATADGFLIGFSGARFAPKTDAHDRYEPTVGDHGACWSILRTIDGHLTDALEIGGFSLDAVGLKTVHFAGTRLSRVDIEAVLKPRAALASGSAGAGAVRASKVVLLSFSQVVEAGEWRLTDISGEFDWTFTTGVPGGTGGKLRRVRGRIQSVTEQRVETLVEGVEFVTGLATVSVPLEEAGAGVRTLELRGDDGLTLVVRVAEIPRSGRQKLSADVDYPLGAKTEARRCELHWAAADAGPAGTAWGFHYVTRGSSEAWEFTVSRGQAEWLRMRFDGGTNRLYPIGDAAFAGYAKDPRFDGFVTGRWSDGPSGTSLGWAIRGVMRLTSFAGMVLADDSGLFAELDWKADQATPRVRVSGHLEVTSDLCYVHAGGKVTHHATIYFNDADVPALVVLANAVGAADSPPLVLGAVVHHLLRAEDGREVEWQLPQRVRIGSSKWFRTLTGAVFEPERPDGWVIEAGALCAIAGNAALGGRPLARPALSWCGYSQYVHVIEPVGSPSPGTGGGFIRLPFVTGYAEREVAVGGFAGTAATLVPAVSDLTAVIANQRGRGGGPLDSLLTRDATYESLTSQRILELLSQQSGAPFELDFSGAACVPGQSPGPLELVDLFGRRGYLAAGIATNVDGNDGGPFARWLPMRLRWAVRGPTDGTTSEPHHLKLLTPGKDASLVLRGEALLARGNADVDHSRWVAWGRNELRRQRVRGGGLVYRVGGQPGLAGLVLTQGFEAIAQGIPSVTPADSAPREALVVPRLPGQPGLTRRAGLRAEMFSAAAAPIAGDVTRLGDGASGTGFRLALRARGGDTVIHEALVAARALDDLEARDGKAFVEGVGDGGAAGPLLLSHLEHCPFEQVGRGAYPGVSRASVHQLPRLPGRPAAPDEGTSILPPVIDVTVWAGRPGELATSTWGINLASATPAGTLQVVAGARHSVVLRRPRVTSRPGEIRAELRPELSGLIARKRLHLVSVALYRNLARTPRPSGKALIVATDNEFHLAEPGSAADARMLLRYRKAKAATAVEGLELLSPLSCAVWPANAEDWMPDKENRYGLALIGEKWDRSQPLAAYPDDDKAWAKAGPGVVLVELPVEEEALREFLQGSRLSDRLRAAVRRILGWTDASIDGRERHWSLGAARIAIVAYQANDLRVIEEVAAVSWALQEATAIVGSALSVRVMVGWDGSTAEATWVPCGYGALTDDRFNGLTWEDAPENRLDWSRRADVSVLFPRYPEEFRASPNESWPDQMVVTVLGKSGEVLCNQTLEWPGGSDLPALGSSP